MAGSFSDLLFKRVQRIYNDPSRRQHVHQEVLGWIADHDRKLPLAEPIAEPFGEDRLPELTHQEDCVIVAALHDRRAQKVGSGTFIPSGSVELREDQGPVERVAVSVALTWEIVCDNVGRLLDNLCGPARDRLRGASREDDQDECERVEQFFCSVFQRVETRLGIVNALNEGVQTRNRADVQVNQSVQNHNRVSIYCDRSAENPNVAQCAALRHDDSKREEQPASESKTGLSSPSVALQDAANLPKNEGAAIGFLGGTRLADALRVHPSQREAFFKQLERRRRSLGGECWEEVANPRPNAPRFIYLADSGQLRALAASYQAPKAV